MSSWLRRKPALDAILREGSPSLLVIPDRRRASPSGFLVRSSYIVWGEDSQKEKELFR